MKNKNLARDIYEIAVASQYGFESKHKRQMENDELIFRTLRAFLISADEKVKMKILGEDTYIDYKIFNNKFSYDDIEENLKIFDYAIPAMKDEVLSEKVSVLEKIAMEKNPKVEVSFIAVRLIEKYFSDKEEINQMMSFYRNESD